MDKSKMCDMKISPVRPDTSSSYLRKIKKPLIERKRRERINNCLSQLKTILLENIKQNGGTQVSKLDKADILEMTVSHLRQVHHQQLSAAMAASSNVVQRYREGYMECATEAVRYMETSRAYPNDMVMRVRTNLAPKMGYPQGHAPSNESFRSEYYAVNDLSALSDISAPSTPVKVKVESPSCSDSVSPDSRFCSAFSPLLMPVPLVKCDQEHSIPAKCSSDSSDDSVLEHEDDNVRPGSSQSKPSQSSKLSLPVRVPVSVGDSPSQKQVWRPF
ncbi:enhancer of split m7 protein-like [Mercenaria mercenaria]|uniref:enhancer of split m7 protein-like n=1 Tax=Mercenaria mercenaria TaxID=6596 RepID=UPI00234EF1C4|nr:enhancer of split m7 protein-like [Mercenaria mercenaria]